MEKIFEQILNELRKLIQAQDALQRGQESLRGEIESLQKGRLQLEKGQNELRQVQDAQSQDLKTIRSGAQDFLDRQKLFEIRMENEVIDKMKALLDSNRSANDTLAGVEQKLTFLLTQVVQSDDEWVFKNKH